MKSRLLVFCVSSTVSLWGQHRHFSWQDACFNNPTLPYCDGHEFYSKHPNSLKDAKPGTGGTSAGDPQPSTIQKLAPSVIVVGSVDWRFADPAADVLAGFKGGKLGIPPLARNMIAELSSRQGLPDSDLHKVFAGLSGAEQIVLSAREGQMVLLVAGRSESSTLPALESGWKAVPVVGNGMLIGNAAAVDQAVERMANQGPLADSTRFAAQQAAYSEFWTVGSGKLAGSQPASQGLVRLSMTASFRDGFKGDATLEFNRVPDEKALGMWPAGLGSATVDGNAIHVQISADADKAAQMFGQIAASPIGQPLATFVKAARSLPAPDANAALRTKPVIYGLDNGPREVK